MHLNRIICWALLLCSVHSKLSETVALIFYSAKNLGNPWMILPVLMPAFIRGFLICLQPCFTQTPWHIAVLWIANATWKCRRGGRCVGGVGGGGSPESVIKEPPLPTSPQGVSPEWQEPSLQPRFPPPRRHKAADLAQNHVTTLLLPPASWEGLCATQRARKNPPWLHFKGGWRGGTEDAQIRSLLLEKSQPRTPYPKDPFQHVPRGGILLCRFGK